MSDIKQAMLDELEEVWAIPAEKRELIDVVKKHLEGMVILPEEPTSEMLEEIWLDDRFTSKALTKRYTAMIRAAK